MDRATYGRLPLKSQGVPSKLPLGRDTVEATVWAMIAAEALLLDRSLRFSPQESALEQGWLLSEMEQRLGYSLEELARRFDRSVSWVSRRLALVELLPETIQQQVREGTLGAQLAMKYLVPVARINVEDCERMAAAFASTVATRGKPDNSMPPGGRARAWSASGSSPSRNCFGKRSGSRRPPGRPRLPGARTGDGSCHSASRRPAARRSPAGDGWPATGTNTMPDRKRAPGTAPDGGAHRKGTGNPTC